MIQVDIKKNPSHQVTYLKVSGHAMKAEPGFDLVCAGVSSVMTGLLNALSELTTGYHMSLLEAPAKIEVFANEPNDRGNLILEVGIIQLKTIEEVESQYIKINYRR